MGRDSEHTARERTVFDLFMKACATFAANVADVRPAEGNFPDITVRLTGDQQIDFELGE